MMNESYQDWFYTRLSNQEYAIKYFRTALETFDKAGEIESELSYVARSLDNLITVYSGTPIDEVDDIFGGCLYWTYLIRGILYQGEDNFDKAIHHFDKAVDYSMDRQYRRKALDLFYEAKSLKSSQEKEFLQEHRFSNELRELSIFNKLNKIPRQSAMI